jgi:hypothetical protein
VLAVAQDDAAEAERRAGLWGPDASPAAADALAELSGSPADVQRSLAARRAALAERETSLQQWAVALECEAARQASQRRALHQQAEQVTCPCRIMHLRSIILCLGDPIVLHITAFPSLLIKS